MASENNGGFGSPPTSKGVQLFPASVANAAAYRNGHMPFINDALIAVDEERWGVAGGADSEGPATSETAAHQRARHRGGVAFSEGDKIRVGGL